MKFSTNIIIKEDPDLIEECIRSEIRNKERSTLKTTKKRGELTIAIGAKDITALRATLNSVLQLLAVYYKTKEI